MVKNILFLFFTVAIGITLYMGGIYLISLLPLVAWAKGVLALMYMIFVPCALLGGMLS